MIFYKIGTLIKKEDRSIRQIAKDMGISHVSLSRIAKAKTPDDYIICSDVIDKMCRYFNCQPGELLVFRK